MKTAKYKNKKNINKTIIIISLLIVFSLIFIFNKYNINNNFKALEPFKIKSFINKYINFNKRLESEISKEKLLEENNLLKKEIDSLNERLNEVESLKNSSYDIEFANITVRNPLYFYKYIIIDKGEESGIKENDLVISSSYLIGRVDTVNKKYSKVDLITNLKDISIEVENKKIYGMISEYKNGYLIVKDINNYEDVKVGDKIYTSGISMYQLHLEIGKIEKIEMDNYNISKILYIKPSANIDNISLVGIIK